MAFAIQEGTQGALSHMYSSHEWTTDAERPKLILSVGVPSAPINLTFTPGNGQITLNWSNLQTDGNTSDATSWSVYRGTTSGSEVLLTGGLTSTTYTDTALANGQSYFYYVIGTNGAGDSAPSNEVGPAKSARNGITRSRRSTRPMARVQSRPRSPLPPESWAAAPESPASTTTTSTSPGPT